MRDENDTKGRRKSAAEAAGRPDHNPAQNGEFDAGPPDQPDERPDGTDFHAAQMPPVAQLRPAGMQPGEALDEIPGFLRRCATETSAQDQSQNPPDNTGPRSVAPHEHEGTHPAAKTSRGGKTRGGRSGKAARHQAGSRKGAAAEAGDYGTGFPTGAVSRAEAPPAAGDDRNADQHGEDRSDWSNTARGALSELLADIDDEQARRISNRDQFAAQAGKRRTTWPLTALIVSFLVVVLAYSARNVDTSSGPGTIWRGAWALLAGPGDETPVPQYPAAQSQLSNLAETPAPAPVAAAPVPVDQQVVRQPALQPVAPVKTTGLNYEPVKIVEPFAGAPLRPPAAAARGFQVASAPASAQRNAVPASPATAASGASITPSPTSTSVALAPSAPASPDKMPLASLAVSETALAPGRALASAADLRRVASVAPDVFGVAAERRANAKPAAANTATFNLAARTPQPLPAAPSQVPTAPDLDGTKAMLSRAERLLLARDLASARLLFERAARYGSAAGAFGAAKTYDPVSFQILGVYGVPPEPEKAIALYQKAIDAGHVEAVKSLGRLNAWLKTTQGRTSTAQR